MSEPCNPNPCKNDGKCSVSDTDSGYTCKCDDNHNGLNCEYGKKK